MNLGNILLSALLLAALALAVAFCACRNRQEGDICCGDCANRLKSCGDREDAMQ